MNGLHKEKGKKMNSREGFNALKNEIYLEMANIGLKTKEEQIEFLFDYIMHFTEQKLQNIVFTGYAVLGEILGIDTKYDFK